MNGAADGPDLNKEVVVGERDESSKVSVGHGQETVEKQTPSEPAACEGSGGEGNAVEKMENATLAGGSGGKDESACVAESSVVVPDGEGDAGNEAVVKASVEVVQIVSDGLVEEVVALEESVVVREGGGDEEANARLPDGAASVAVPDGRDGVSDPVTGKVAEVVGEGVSEVVVVVMEKRVEVKTISEDIDGNNLGNSNMENNNYADDTREDPSVDDDSKKQKIADANASAQAEFGLAPGEGSSDIEVGGVKLDQATEDKAKGVDLAGGEEGSSSVEVEGVKLGQTAAGVTLDQTAEDQAKRGDFGCGDSAELGKAQTDAEVVEITRLENIEVVESDPMAVDDGSDLVDAKASVSSGPDDSEEAEESRKGGDVPAAEQSNGTSVSPAEGRAEAPLPDANDERLVQTTGTEGIPYQDEGTGGEDGGANSLHEHEDENSKEQTLSLDNAVDHSKNVAVTSPLAEASSMDGQHNGTSGNPTHNNTLDDGRPTCSVSDGLQNTGADDSKVNDSLPGETQNNGGIWTDGNEEVKSQNVKKEDSSLGKHDVTADGEEIEEAKSDEKIEPGESISEEKVPESKDMENDEGVEDDDCSDERVPENQDMEIDEGVEDDEVDEVSYFDEVLPEDLLSQEDKFSVGDIVWGKIRSHPWWPGQVFDAADSSEKALKYSRKDTFLIAYFGDRTFAWCDEFQLKTFWTNFARMEKQSSSNAFLNAMDCALEEVARRTELGMTCSCFPEEAYKKLKSPEVENAGIREGITVPDDVGRSLSVASFKPEKFLEYVKEMALFPPKKGINRLELTFVQAQLSAFYSAKGYLNLPAFHIYGGFDETGLSPAKQSHAGGTVGIATPSPRREGPTTPASLAESGEGKSHASSSRKRKRLLVESPHRSRKQRSLAELMDMKGRQKKSQKSRSVSPSSKKKKDSESVSLSSGKKKQKLEASLSSGKKKPKSESKLSSGKKNQKSKSISPSSGKKKKDSDSVESSRRRGRRRSTSSGDAETTGEEAPDAATSGKGNKSKTGSNDKETSKKKRRRFDSSENTETAGEEAPGDASGGVSKASKKPKSKLVSPPSGKRQEKHDAIATPEDSTQKKRRSSLSGDIDAETPSMQKSFKIGDRITKIASQLTGPPIIKCNSDSSHKDLTDAKMVKDSKRGSATTPQTPRASSEKKKRVPKIASSSDEMLALLGTAAENPLKGIESSSVVIDFFTDFRSSLYEKGSSNKRYRKSVEKRDQNRKLGGKTSSDSDSGRKKSDAKSTKGRSSISKTTVDYSSPEEGSSKTGRKRKAKSSTESPVRKQKSTPQASTSPSPGLKLDSEGERAAGVTDSELSKDLQEGNKTGVSDEKSGEECSPTALILTFTEGDTLPSESDLSRIFSRYGPLEESETEVLRKTSRARVVFKKRPDAEVAFSSAGKFSIFGPSLVSYRLRYLSSTSKDSPRSAMRGIKEAASADGNIKSPFPG